jgi:hypothetical protein
MPHIVVISELVNPQRILIWNTPKKFVSKTHHAKDLNSQIQLKEVPVIFVLDGNVLILVILTINFENNTILLKKS